MQDQQGQWRDTLLFYIKRDVNNNPPTHVTKLHDQKRRRIFRAASDIHSQSDRPAPEEVE